MKREMCTWCFSRGRHISRANCAEITTDKD